MKRQVRDWEEIFFNTCMLTNWNTNVLYNGQISTTRQLNFKNQQEIWTETSPNKIYRQVSMWKDAQYILMLIKTKWDIPTYQSG